MGLKYEVFMIKGTADDLYHKLLETCPDRFVDVSDLLRKERDWYHRPVKTLEDMKAEPDPELAEFMRTDKKSMYLWWMDHPTRQGFVVGGYTSHWMLDHEFTAIICYFLKKIGIDEFLNVVFAHGSNDGSIYKLYLQTDPPKIDQYPHEEGEKERWDRYSKRVDKVCGFPVLAWHRYMSNPNLHFVPWKYELEIKKSEKSQNKED